MKLKSFSQGFVRSGSKNVSESAPKVTLTPTAGTFKLNNKALALLGVVPGEGTVGMFDMFGTDVATDQENIYYIAGNIEGGAKVGKGRSFSYATVYNTMLKGDIEVNSTTLDDLVKDGLMIKRSNKTDLYISLWTITADLVQFGDEEVELPDGTTGYVYRLTNFTKYPHTPKGGNAEVVEEEVAIEG